MKKMLIVISIFLLNACMNITTNKQYSYRTTDKKNNIITIVGQLTDENNEYSPLSYFEISDRRNETYVKHKIKLVSDKIEIIENRRKYVIPYSKSKSDNDTYLYIEVSKNDINIVENDFIVYIGKVELDTGEIVDIPPLHFKKHIYIQRFKNPLVLADPNGKFEQYYNTVEEYKKNGWKEE